MKKVSIVTVTYNAYNTLESTIKSILSQDMTLIEFIIIDGGSQDGTIDIIKKYNKKIDFWISEKDNGIYDAMNKSLNYVNTEWVCFMNAGDTFYNNNIVNMIFQDNFKSNIDIIYGNHAYFKNNQLVIKQPLSLKYIWKRMPICHQSIFSKSIILKNNQFNINFKYASDYEFILKHYIKFPTSFFYFNFPISIITPNGFSESNSINTYKEYMVISKMYYKNPFKTYYHKFTLIRILFTYFIKKLIN